MSNSNRVNVPETMWDELSAVAEKYGVSLTFENDNFGQCIIYTGVHVDGYVMEGDDWYVEYDG
jgi:hypothetical protein